MNTVHYFSRIVLLFSKKIQLTNACPGLSKGASNWRYRQLLAVNINDSRKKWEEISGPIAGTGHHFDHSPATSNIFDNSACH